MWQRNGIRGFLRSIVKNFNSKLQAARRSDDQSLIISQSIVFKSFQGSLKFRDSYTETVFVNYSAIELVHQLLYLFDY